jgi:hypothetical protein
MDAVMTAYEEVGIRVVFGLQYADRKSTHAPVMHRVAEMPFSAK